MKIVIFLLFFIITSLQGNAQLTSVSENGFHYETYTHKSGVQSLWYSAEEIRRRKNTSISLTFLPSVSLGIYLTVAGTENIFVSNQGALSIFWASLIIGPAIGYLDTDQEELSIYAFRGLLQRIALIPAAVATTFMMGVIFGFEIGDYKGIDFDKTVFVLSTLMLGAHALVDIIRLESRFQTQSRSVGLSSLSIQPAALYAANNTLAPGIQFNLKF